VGRDRREYHVDGIYHLTSHGVDDRPIFRDDVDRQAFTLRLLRIAMREDWQLYAVCLMDTHHHIVVRPTQGVVDSGMRVLNGAHSRQFNERHGRRGALFEARYTATPIRDEEHLSAAIEYVLANPVTAGMVEAVEDWPWSTWEGSPLAQLLKRCLTP
jgi:REP element-mobilizing transposase RayT